MSDWKVMEALAKKSMTMQEVAAYINKSCSTATKHVNDLYYAVPKQAYIHDWEVRGEGRNARYVARYALGNKEDADQPLGSARERAAFLVRLKAETTKRDPLVAALFGQPA